MANKRQKLESDVLRFRNQGNWEKAKEGLKQLVSKYGLSDPVVRLIQNEVELETYLLENEPRSENVKKAQMSLPAVKKNLAELQSCECKNSQFKVSEEASMLLAKMHYAQGNLSASLDIYNDINIEESAVGNLYKMRILSEAFAIKGLCMEQVPSVLSSDDSNVLIQCYETSVQLIMKYLINHDKVYNTRNTMCEDALVSYVVETAIRRGTMYHIKNNNIWRGVNLLRQFLKTLHSNLPSHLQQTLSCKLATILLRGISTIEYKKEDSVDELLPGAENMEFIDKKSELISGLDDSALSTLSPPSYSSQTKPKFFLGEKEFAPSSIEQEAILLLLVSEIMLNMDPVLDMSPEHALNREETLCNAELLYDLLSVVTVPLGQHSLFNACIEKSLKYTFDRFHLWHQYALSLYAAGNTNQALQSLSECCRIKPDDPVSALAAAKACFGQLPLRIDEGLKYAQLAVDMTEASFDTDGLRSRAHLAVGVGMTLKALSSSSNKEQSQCRENAISAYTKAHTSDPFDHKPLAYLSLEFAYARKISLAFKKVKRALDFNPEDPLSLHLLILLLTSRSQHHEAKHTLQSALQMYPENISLLATKCKLEQLMGEHDEALRTCDEIMKLWSNKSETRCVSLQEGTMDRMTNDALSFTNQSCGNELDGGSVLTNSVIASRYDQTPSDIESSLADLQPRLASMTSVHSEAWLQVSEVYLALGRLDDAEMCVSEAVQIHPLSPSVLYMRGRLHEQRREITEACLMYNNALTVDPTHIKATEHLAGILRSQGKFGFAKKLLQDAVKLDVMSHTIWQHLAEIMECDGDVDGAIECTTFALNLESSSSVLPFTILIPQL